MKLCITIKKIREAKKLSQKEVAATLKMDQAQYSRIENGKTNPSFSAVEKIAKTLGVNFSELLEADQIFREVNSADKTLMEKIRLVEALDKIEKNAFFAILDALVTKKKLKDSLSNALSLTQ